jgi:hypothetical protein
VDKLKQREYYRDWYAKNGRKRYPSHLEKIKEWASAHPNSKKAMEIVTNARKKGIITKPLVCELCNRNTKLVAHHFDYSKPLDITWVCASCHKRIHQVIDPIDKPYDINSLDDRLKPIKYREKKPKPIKEKKTKSVKKKVRSKKKALDGNKIMVYDKDMVRRYIDLDNLREAIREMTYQQGIYKVLREELTIKGYWHNLPRGKHYRNKNKKEVDGKD